MACCSPVVYFRALLLPWLLLPAACGKLVFLKPEDSFKPFRAGVEPRPAEHALTVGTSAPAAPGGLKDATSDSGGQLAPDALLSADATAAHPLLAHEHSPWNSILLLSLGVLAVKMASSCNFAPTSTALPVLGFMACSSLMLIVNKMAVQALPMPVTVLAAQLLFCSGVVRLCGALGWATVEPLRFQKVMDFGATPIAFLATLVANIKVLEHANVETFIMVRNATPLVTSVLDWLFLGRDLPDRYSLFALLLALAGAAGYMLADAHFEMLAYSWAGAWLLIFLFDQVYIKHVVSTVPMSPWTRVYYNNVLAAIPAVAAACVVERADWPTLAGLFKAENSFALAMLATSCVIGTAMSYCAFCARDALSATAFTVVGNVCKVLSVLINFFVWDKHATNLGLLALFVCIAGSALYRPAELRSDRSK